MGGSQVSRDQQAKGHGGGESLVIVTKGEVSGMQRVLVEIITRVKRTCYNLGGEAWNGKI